MILPDLLHRVVCSLANFLLNGGDGFAKYSAFGFHSCASVLSAVVCKRNAPMEIRREVLSTISSVCVIFAASNFRV